MLTQVNPEKKKIFITWEKIFINGYNKKRCVRQT